MGKVKILIVENSVDITGAFKAILTVVNDLKNQYDFCFAIPRKSKIGQVLQRNQIPYYSLPFVEISKSPKNLMLYFPILFVNALVMKKIVRKEGVSIVHTNDIYNLTAIVAKFLGSKIFLISHVRFLLDRFPTILVKFWRTVNIKSVDVLICVSDAVKEYFSDSEKIIRIYDPLPNKERYPPSNNSKNESKIIRLLYIGNYISGKGQDGALEAFKQAFALNKSLRIKFVGGDMGSPKNMTFKKGLENFTIKNDLQHVVELGDFVEDVEKEIKEADICLNFSQSESFSLTCLDALFFGTPLIASDCGGPKELFEDGNSGILVPNKDIRSLVQAILFLASNNEVRERFSKSGRSFVRQKFSKENTSLKIGSIYLNCLNRKK